MFEQLDKSLEDFMVERKRQHVPLREVRPMLLQVSAAGLHYLHKCCVQLSHLRMFQLARALDFLKAESFMHADIKLENVMLVNHQKEPFRVKLIDFGLAEKVSKVEKGQTLQTLSYRSDWTLASESSYQPRGERGVALICLCPSTGLQKLC